MSSIMLVRPERDRVVDPKGPEAHDRPLLPPAVSVAIGWTGAALGVYAVEWAAHGPFAGVSRSVVALAKIAMILIAGAVYARSARGVPSGFVLTTGIAWLAVLDRGRRHHRDWVGPRIPASRRPARDLCDPPRRDDFRVARSARPFCPRRRTDRARGRLRAASMKDLIFLLLTAVLFAAVDLVHATLRPDLRDSHWAGKTCWAW